MARFWCRKTQLEIVAFLKDDRSKHQKQQDMGELYKNIKKRSPLDLFLSTASLASWCLVSNPLAAQVTPDGSLNTEVNTNNNVTEITGGTQAESNLFHSFQDFSVEADNTAFFNNGAEISNIISRVTGSNISEINGVIKANGEANLVLINPNGINLGDGASLDIGGSFLGSTADSVVFGDGSVFSSNLDAQPLLTVTAPVGLQLGANSAQIEVSGSDASNLGLEVKPGHTFALVGNGMTFNGGTVTAESGRIDLGSVASGGVSITEIAAGWQLGYEAVTQFGDLQLLTRSALLNPNSAANPTGGIQVQGKNVTLERSQIAAQTLADAPGGNIVVNAAESLSLTGTAEPGENSSQISNNVNEGATGQGGAIDITTNRLDVNPRSFIDNSIFGSGSSGDIKIAATEINLTGAGFLEFQQRYRIDAFEGTLQPGSRITGIFSQTGTNGTAGNMQIETNSLNLTEGAIIFAPVFTAGNGGNIDITATDTNLNASSIQSGGGVTSELSATVGDINLNSDRLSVSNGATVINLTFGGAPGGSLNVVADSINLVDTPPSSIVGTGLYTNTSLGTGTGGELNVNAETIAMKDAVISSNSGALLANGAIIPLGGLGGDLNIKASESITASGILFNTDNPELAVGSGLGTTTYSSSDGGNLSIDTAKLVIRDGANFTSATFGAGNGGELTINATDSVELIGVNTEMGMNQGGLFASSENTTASNIGINSASGNISITTSNLSVRDGAIIDVQSTGEGNAGSIDINTDSTSLSSKGTLSATTENGAGGNIQIDTKMLRLDRGLINASVFGSGTGGDIEITAEDSIEISGSGFEMLQSTLFDPAQLSPKFLANLSIDLITDGIVAASIGDGDAGTIRLQGANIELEEGGLIATATANSGSAGSIFLNASESVLVDSSFVSNNTLFDGQGGNVTIDTARLEIVNGGQLTVSTLAGSGNSGNVTVNASESVTVSGNAENTPFTSNISVGAGAPSLETTTGNGGDLSINTPKLNVSDRAVISIGSVGSGNAGRLQVNADTITLDSQGIISADTQSGEGANIIFNANNIIWQGGSFTTATSRGAGNGGNITIDANNLVAIESSRLIADSFRGMGGNIQIQTQGLFICPTCEVSASSELGVDGVVDIETLEPTSLEVLETRSQLTKPQEEVAVACPAEKGLSTSQLTITGRGGLPSRPQEMLNATSTIEFEAPNAKIEESSISRKTSLPAPARGWYKDAQGSVVLTAQAKVSAANNSIINSADCHTHK